MDMQSNNSDLTRDRLNVLCIDEGQSALADRTALLESAGYRVFSAMGANAAMQLFVTHEIDLVLSNNHLRGVSGAELSIFMKQVKPVHVVLLTNSAQIPADLLSHVDACMEQDGPTKDLLLCLQQVLPKQST
jgi:CheY-like chemotaxis protein